MIEQARAEHIPFIHKRLSDIKKTPETLDEICSFIESNENAIYVESDQGIVCRLYHNQEKQINQVAWLLPQDELRLDLYFVMSEALLEISRRFPQDDNWRTQARFADRRGCLSIIKKDLQAENATKAFYKLFPNSSHFKWEWKDFSWRIWGIQGEIVQDILAMRPRFEGVRHGSQAAYLQ
jgi:hypothetical protein